MTQIDLKNGVVLVHNLEGENQKEDSFKLVKISDGKILKTRPDVRLGHAEFGEEDGYIYFTDKSADRYKIQKIDFLVKIPEGCSSFVTVLEECISCSEGYKMDSASKCVKIIVKIPENKKDENDKNNSTNNSTSSEN